jgi:hypothetical protein
MSKKNHLPKETKLPARLSFWCTHEFKRSVKKACVDRDTSIQQLCTRFINDGLARG